MFWALGRGGFGVASGGCASLYRYNDSSRYGTGLVSLPQLISRRLVLLWEFQGFILGGLFFFPTSRVQVTNQSYHIISYHIISYHIIIVNRIFPRDGGVGWLNMQDTGVNATNIHRCAYRHKSYRIQATCVTAQISHKGAFPPPPLMNCKEPICRHDSQSLRILDSESE